MKNNTPFFSVVIPVYNKGPHIHRSISSVLNQTFHNFELILVDDASTDNSLEEINKFTDKRIRLFQRNEPGPGGYAARNLGIEKANGKWIAFLDADDEWYPVHLDKMYELQKKYPDIYFMSCGWQKQKEGNNVTNEFFKQFYQKGEFTINVSEYLKFGITKMLPVWTSVACIKKSSPIALNLFPADLEAKRGGDLHAWLKIICYHKKMAWSNHIGAIYHIDSINMVTNSATASPKLMSKSVYQSFAYNLNYDEKSLLKKYLNKRLQNSLVLSIRNKQKESNWQYLRNIHWKGDLFNALKLTIISYLPISVFFYIKLKLK